MNKKIFCLFLVMLAIMALFVISANAEEYHYEDFSTTVPSSTKTDKLYISVPNHPNTNTPCADYKVVDGVLQFNKAAYTDSHYPEVRINYDVDPTTASEVFFEMDFLVSSEHPICSNNDLIIYVYLQNKRFMVQINPSGILNYGKMPDVRNEEVDRDEWYSALIHVRIKDAAGTAVDKVDIYQKKKTDATYRLKGTIDLETRSSVNNYMQLYGGANKVHYVNVDNVKVYDGVNVKNPYFTMDGEKITSINDVTDNPFTITPIESDYLTTQKETDGNYYTKFATGLSEAGYVASMDYFSQFQADVDLPETFILSFDANNASLGSALDVEIYGACATDEAGNNVNGIPKRSIYLRSGEDIQNKWYSYKVVCTGTPKQAGNIEIEAVYRKERDKNEAYTLLSGKAWAGKNALDQDVDYGIGSTMGGNGNFANINSVKFGDCRRSWLGYYTTGIGDTVDAVAEAKNQAYGAWYIDNVMITEAAAVTGDFAVAEDVLSANVNLSTAEASSTPILAVYDDDVLVDVDFTPVASHVGTANLSADYASSLTNPKAMFYLWDSLTVGKPLLNEIEVASYID